MAFQGNGGSRDLASDDENDDTDEILIRARPWDCTGRTKTTSSQVQHILTKDDQDPQYKHTTATFELPSISFDSDDDSDIGDGEICSPLDLKQKLFDKQRKKECESNKHKCQLDEIPQKDIVWTTNNDGDSHERHFESKECTDDIMQEFNQILKEPHEDHALFLESQALFAALTTVNANSFNQGGQSKTGSVLRKQSSGIFSQDGLQSSSGSFEDVPDALIPHPESDPGSPALDNTVFMSDSGVFESPTLTIPNETSKEIDKALLYLSHKNGSFDNLSCSVDPSPIPTSEDEGSSESEPLMGQLEHLKNSQALQGNEQNSAYDRKLSGHSESWTAQQTYEITKHGSTDLHQNLQSDAVVERWIDIKAQVDGLDETASSEYKETETVFLDLRPKADYSAKGKKDLHVPNHALPSLSYVGMAASKSCDDATSDDDDGDFAVWSETRKKLKMHSVKNASGGVKLDKKMKNKGRGKRQEYPCFGSRDSGNHSHVISTNQSVAYPESNSHISKTDVGANFPQLYNFEETHGNKSLHNVRLVSKNKDAQNIRCCNQEAAAEDINPGQPISLDKEIEITLEEKERFIAELSKPAIEALDDYHREKSLHDSSSFSSSDDSSCDEEPVASLNDSDSYSSSNEGQKFRSSVSSGHFYTPNMRRGNFGSYDLINSSDEAEKDDESNDGQSPDIGNDADDLSPEAAADSLGSIMSSLRVGCFKDLEMTSLDGSCIDVCAEKSTRRDIKRELRTENELSSLPSSFKSAFAKRTEEWTTCGEKGSMEVAKDPLTVRTRLCKQDELGHSLLKTTTVLATGATANNTDGVGKVSKAAFDESNCAEVLVPGGVQKHLKQSNSSRLSEPSPSKNDKKATDFKDKDVQDYGYSHKKVILEGFEVPSMLLNYLSLKKVPDQVFKKPQKVENVPSGSKPGLVLEQIDAHDLQGLKSLDSLNQTNSTSLSSVSTDRKLKGMVVYEGSDESEVVESSKNKRKSKRKTNKSAAVSDKGEITVVDKQVVEQKADIKLQNSKETSKTTETVRKNKSTFGRKENDIAKLKELVKKFQRANDFPPLIYDQDLSFADDVSGLPTTCGEKSCLLLTVALQAPGICDRQPTSKTPLSTLEGINAYIGLSTLFLSLLPNKKINVSQRLEIPFNVISFQQIILENEMRLCIGVIENDVIVKQVKRGKVIKSRKSFCQGVNQYLNSTDLETILAKLEKLATTSGQESIIRGPVHGKLSSFVCVNPDENALKRVFSLAPSLFWRSEYKSGQTLSSNTTWLPKKNYKNEITVLTVESVFGIQPRDLYFLYTKILTMDIVGVRLAYLQSKDSTDDKAVLVMALSDLASTSVQGASKLVPMLHNQIRIDVRYVPRDLKSMHSYSGDPLLTYSIGKRRADRELTFWFGKRLSHMSENDLSAELATYTKLGTKNPRKSGFEELNSLSGQIPSVHFLSSVSSRTLLALSPLVPSSFLPTVLEQSERLGLSVLGLGKTLFSVERAGLLGLSCNSVSGSLKTDGTVPKSKGPSNVLDSYGMWVLVMEGENAVYRVVRLIHYLTGELRKKTQQNGIGADISNSKIDRDRNSCDYFGSAPLSTKNVQIVEDMCTTVNYPNINFEDLKSQIPVKNLKFNGQDQPELCVLAITGQRYVDQYVDILKILLACPVAESANSESDDRLKNGYCIRSKPGIEIIGMKHITKMNQVIAEDVNPKIEGSFDHLLLSWKLQGQPVTILVLRGRYLSKYLAEELPRLERSFLSKLNAEDYPENGISSHNFFVFDHELTVLKFMMTYFETVDLSLESSSSISKDRRWPVYLYEDHWTFAKSSYFKLPPNVFRSVVVHVEDFVKGKMRTEAKVIKVVHPKYLSLPHQIVLREESTSLSVLSIGMDSKHTKLISKAMQRLNKDLFHVVGLMYPGDHGAHSGSSSTMNVVLKRENAVERLKDWVPVLTKEMNGKHSIEATPTSSLAKESILKNFKNTRGLGIFDWSPLSLAEQLAFAQDDIFTRRDRRTVIWLDSRRTQGKQSSESNDTVNDVKYSNELTGNLLEINVILISNGLLRGKHLGRNLPDSMKCFGFWEKLCSLSFETIGMRMTSLTHNEMKSLLDGCNVELHRKPLENNLSSWNGPLLAVVLQRDFAISNFWTLIEKHYNEQDLRYLHSNVFVPTKKDQVECLLKSLFEKVAENPKVKVCPCSATKS